jgi:hypothetical protein
MKIIKEKDLPRRRKLMDRKIPYSMSLMKNLINAEKDHSIDKLMYKQSLNKGRGKSFDVVESDHFKKIKESNKIKKLSNFHVQANLTNLESIQFKPKKKKVRYSLNDSKKKPKSIREKLLNQLLSKRESEFDFAKKKYKSNVQSGIMGKTADSLILKKLGTTNKSIKKKGLSLQKRIQGKLKSRYGKEIKVRK